MRPRLALCLFPLALWGCRDEPATPMAPGLDPAATIVDAARGSGEAGFYFLTPIAPGVAYPGTFDATLAPVVEVCRWTGAACDGAPVARYTLTEGTGAVLLRVIPTAQHYRVDWPVRGLPRGVIHRIRVLLNGAELGHADAQVPALGQTAGQLSAQGIVPLGNSSRLAIRFRLEEGVGEDDPEPEPTGRQAAVEAVAAEASALSTRGLSRGAFNAALAQFIATQPEFAASGVHEASSSVWARFPDGRLLILGNNRDAPTPEDDPFALNPAVFPSLRAASTPRPPSGLAIPAHSATRQSSFPAAVRTVAGPPLAAAFADPFISEIPTSAQARMLIGVSDTFWTGDYEVRSRITSWLEDANYTSVPGNNTTIEGLQGVTGDGFFYFSTHGSIGIGADLARIYALQTSTPIEWSSDPGSPEVRFAADLNANRLVYVLNDNGARTSEGAVIWDPNYGITAGFVTEYMSFEGTVVLISACGSFTDDSKAFRDAVLAKGASVYFGWTKEEVKVGASLRVALYLVDRMLGANLYETYPEDPPQRPFDWPAVLVNMEETGISTDLVTEAVFQAAPNPSGEPLVGILAPSIMIVNVEENQEEAEGSLLYLTGIFGSNPCRPGLPPCTDGDVTVDGVSLNVKQWGSEFILADLPRTGEAASGDVVVTVRDHESNPRRLVRWTGPFTYTHNDMGSLSFTVTIGMNGRGDPGPIRNFPGDAPQSVTSPVFDPATQASGTFVASGTFSIPLGSCTLTETWTGAGTIRPSLYEEVFENGFFSHFAEFDFNARTAQLHTGFAVPVTVRHTSDGPECPPPTELLGLYREAIQAYDALRFGQLGLLNVTLTDEMNIVADSRSRAVPTRNNMAPGTATAVINWGSVGANPPYEILEY